jgi:hypothetical protein
MPISGSVPLTDLPWVANDLPPVGWAARGRKIFSFGDLTFLTPGHCVPLLRTVSFNACRDDGKLSRSIGPDMIAVDGRLLFVIQLSKRQIGEWPNGTGCRSTHEISPGAEGR